MRPPIHAGADEAGRGPVLGPLVVAAVAPDGFDLNFRGIKDSKLLSRKARDSIAHKSEAWKIRQEFVVLHAADINNAWPDTNLDALIRSAYAHLLNRLRPERAVIGTVGRDTAMCSQAVEELLDCPCVVEARIGAENTDAAVALASILAKNRRDALMDALRVEYGDIGSGYPGSKATQSFIKAWFVEHGTPPPISRYHWKTIRWLTETLQ